MNGLGLHRYARIVASATLLLIMAGGLVTSTDSGLAVPDWPLSFGSFFPPMVGGVRFEHTHRVIAGLVALLTLGLVVFAFKTEKRRWVRFFALGAFSAVLLQAALGGITVLYKLPTLISVFHACLGQTFFCLLVCLALFTSPEWKMNRRIPLADGGSLKRIAVVTTVFIYLQLAAGAFVRHAEGRGVSLHVVLAFLILMHVLFIFLRVAQEEPVRKRLFGNALFLGLLVVCQIFLGFGSLITTLMLPKAEAPRVIEVLLTTAHQTTGAMILAACLVLTLRLIRHADDVPSEAPDAEPAAEGAFAGDAS